MSAPRTPTRPQWEREQLLKAAQRVARELKKAKAAKRKNPRRRKVLKRQEFEARTYGGHWRPLGAQEYRDYKAGRLKPDHIRPLTAARKKKHLAAIAWMRSRQKPATRRRKPAVARLRSRWRTGKVRPNMTRLTARPFYIIAKRGSGPHLPWNGRSFSDTVEPERFSSQAEAVKIASQLWVLHPKIGRLGYQLWVSDQVPGRRRVNPQRRSAAGVPRAAVDEAAAKFKDFTGREPGAVTKTSLSDDQTSWELGPIRSIEYEATRDNETARWRHPFKKRSRPLLTASRDGSQLHIVGGRYEVTDAGIEDR